MLISLRVFSVIAMLLGSLKKSESLCSNFGKSVTCKSILYLSTAEINRIPNISEVTYIYIRYSPDLEIFPTAFEPAVNLHSLDISFNRNIKLYKETFQNMELEFLDLSNNSIKSLHPSAFYGSKIKVLTLRDNYLTEIPKALANLSSLVQLNLAGNKIQSTNNGEIGLPILQNLFLNENKLEWIFLHGILTHPQRLKALALHQNSLTAVTNYMLQHLTNLEYLDLGYNSISFIETNSFAHTPKLKLLTLSKNNLKSINENVLPRGGLPLLEHFYLDKNKLMYLSPNVFARLESLKAVSIVGNPWWCSCFTTLEELLEASNIKQECTEDYDSGVKPICVGDGASDAKCRHIYNEELSERYWTYHSLTNASGICSIQIVG